MGDGIFSRQEGGSAGGAERTVGDGVFEPGSFASQLIDIGRDQGGIARAVQIHGAMLIDQNEQQIGGFWIGLGGESAQGQSRSGGL